MNSRNNKRKKWLFVCSNVLGCVCRWMEVIKSAASSAGRMSLLVPKGPAEMNGRSWVCQTDLLELRAGPTVCREQTHIIISSFLICGSEKHHHHNNLTLDCWLSACWLIETSDRRSWSESKRSVILFSKSFLVFSLMKQKVGVLLF